jgi:hypothetical protein
VKVIKPTPVTAGAFARASTATYINSAGVMQTAAIDVPRVTFDPTTKAFQGYLAELATTNLQIHSSQFGDVAWTKTGTTVAVNTATAPDGTTSMDRLVEDSSTGAHTLTSAGRSVTAGQAYTFSVFVKADSGSRRIGLSPGYSPHFASTDFAIFDLATGAFTSTGTLTCAVTAFDGGIYRIAGKATALSTGSATSRIELVSGATSTYTGDGTSSVFLWGAQYEQGNLSSYYATTHLTATRAADMAAGGLVYTNVTDVDAAYAAGTPYTINQRVTYDKQIWECILSPSTGNTPTTSPTYWLNKGPSNSWAAFDSQVSTASTAATEQIYILKPGYASGLSLFGLVGSSVEVSVLSEPGGALLRSSVFLLDGAIISDWYQYYFSEAEQQTEYILTDLSTYDLSYVTVRIVGSTTRCGHLSVGKVIDLGGSQYGASVGITDYSTKKTDANGVTTFVQKGYSKDLSVNTLFDKSQLNGIYKTLAGLRATPCTWIVADEAEYAQLTTFGNIRDFSINVEYYSTSLCNFDIQGLSE